MRIQNKMREYERVVVTGNPGSGKTTLALQLSERLGIPHIEIDVIYDRASNGTFKRNVLNDVFRKEASSKLSSGTWVACGGYINHRDLLWENADTIIWLNYALPIIFLRQLKRSYLRLVLNRGNRPNDIYGPRSIQALFRELRIFRLILNHYRRKKQLKMIFQDLSDSGKNIIELTTPQGTDEWLNQIVL